MNALEYNLKSSMQNTRLDVVVEKHSPTDFSVYIVEDTGSYSMDDPFYKLVEKGIQKYSEAVNIARDAIDYMHFQEFGCVRFSYLR